MLAAWYIGPIQNELIRKCGRFVFFHVSRFVFFRLLRGANDLDQASVIVVFVAGIMRFDLFDRLPVAGWRPGLPLRLSAGRFLAIVRILSVVRSERFPERFASEFWHARS